jgi:hypothetical protein
VPLLLLPLPAVALLLPAGPTADGGSPVMLSTVKCSVVAIACSTAKHVAAASFRYHSKYMYGDQLSLTTELVCWSSASSQQIHIDPLQT